MGKIAFVFPGQGAQAVGMGKAAVEGSPAARKLFDDAAKILGFDLLKLCLEGPKERLDATDISQPALFVASLAALETVKATEPGALDECFAAAGLSLGEYTALVFAGAMSFEDGLRVVRKRGQAMQAAAEATPGGMVSVLGFELPQVQELVDEAKVAGTLQIANYLCPGNTVVSGAKAACEKLVEVAEAKGARTIPLAVAGAFHTDLMKPADERLAEALEGVTMNAPRVPVWSNVDARPHVDPAEIKALLVRQVLSPVRWEETTRGLLAAGAEGFHEIGPGRVLAGLLKRVERKMPCKNTA